MDCSVQIIIIFDRFKNLSPASGMMIRLYQKKIIWFSLFAAWTIYILYMSLRPSPSEILKKHLFEFRMDYLLHFAAYFVLGSLFVVWRGNRRFEIRGIELALVSASAISFSILMEYIQLLIPGRAYNVVDMVYNVLGVIGGVGITYFYIVRHFLRRIDKKNIEKINPSQ
jgi:VanZ family protein